ncbi:hypothetical protein P3X46_013156 [Hevea brasiliensis]|uniref:F-box domain-containing protein n=1 Tax=Hevea brasiliensis TaxID=3981 RepID=A0ABQ9M6J1_HEVBR|nr:F-box protein CPR1 [Hevea brasiliensis]KAJ9174519.1 hypothetical protein P3X46_013156 [Hevea brasiliensis]
MSDYLPPEVLLEILVRLPAKSLLQCSCVSKLWYSLISSPNFIFMHAHFTSTTNKNKHAQIMIRHYSRTYGKEIFTVHFNRDMSFGDYQLLDCPVKSSNGYLLDIVGSCNGLVCLTDSGIAAATGGGYMPQLPNPKPIFLWNPSLGKSMTLPLRGNSGRRLVLGLGFDSKSFDYKVVRIEFRYGAVSGIDIFALSENSWRRSYGAKRKVGFPSYDFLKLPQAFVNGNIHWIGYHQTKKEGLNHRTLIVATFDVGNEVFGELAMPNETAHEVFLPDENYQLSLVVFNRSLSLIRYDEGHNPYFNRCCIWMMNEYGMAQSWTKLYTICPYNGFSKTLDIMSNGKFLLVTNNGELVSFDPESRAVNRLKVYGESCSFNVDTYVESLVLSKGFNRILGKASSSNATFHGKA